MDQHQEKMDQMRVLSQHGLQTPPNTPPRHYPGVDPNAPSDINKILLPNKEIHGIDSLQRGAAGAVLADQRTPMTSTTLPMKNAADLLHKPQTNPDAVQSLQTYQGDITAVMHKDGMSAIKIAAAEVQRRSQLHTQSAAPAVTTRSVLVLVVSIAASIILLVGTGVAMAYIFFWQTVPVPPAAFNASFIRIDLVVGLPLPARAAPAQVVTALANTLQETALSLGMVLQIRPTHDTGTKDVSYFTAQEFVQTALPRMPEILLRSLKPDFIVGAHSYDAKLPFMMFAVNSYEHGYSGMLKWEDTLVADLAPFFLAPKQAPVIPVTATSTDLPQATSTNIRPPAPTISIFRDEIIENNDARVLRDSVGNIVLFWTYIDRSTVVIAKDAATLREIIARRAKAPGSTP